MSYERVRVQDIRVVAGKNGQRHHFLQVSVMQTCDVYMNDTALTLVSQYRALVGQECLIPVVWRERDGRSSLTFEGDCMPLPVAAPSTVSVASKATRAKKRS